MTFIALASDEMRANLWFSSLPREVQKALLGECWVVKLKAAGFRRHEHMVAEGAIFLHYGRI